MDRTVLITGGSGGLGAPVTRAFLDDGWRVVVPIFDESERARMPSDAGLQLVAADLFDEASVKEVVDAAAAPEAPLRAVVNLVGGFAAGGRVHETSVDDFEKQFRLNLRPTYLVCAAAIPHLLNADTAAIACVSTRAALRPFSGAAGYISSKAAILAFVDALAAEYRDDDIRVNAILPSVIDTPGNRASQPDADHSTWVSPKQIADVLLFLCGDGSTVVSGAHVPVYGKA
ncbi:SDR family oxidoreductase [Svornostia abyssi]|uniref:SDR family oxidoreductase n=1 Tax=Svornostia abyssi TaxID=2898438 RepID=A0ABY5PI59_9ACTN|nr:SDR family oxidoreductase [Parviterribacteraceae bacterium J379]